MPSLETPGPAALAEDLCQRVADAFTPLVVLDLDVLERDHPRRVTAVAPAPGFFDDLELSGRTDTYDLFSLAREWWKERHPDAQIQPFGADHRPFALDAWTDDALAVVEETAPAVVRRARAILAPAPRDCTLFELIALAVAAEARDLDESATRVLALFTEVLSQVRVNAPASIGSLTRILDETIERRARVSCAPNGFVYTATALLEENAIAWYAAEEPGNMRAFQALAELALEAAAALAALGIDAQSDERGVHLASALFQIAARNHDPLGPPALVEAIPALVGRPDEPTHRRTLLASLLSTWRGSIAELAGTLDTLLEPVPA